MGYATDYKVEAGPFETQEDAEFFEFKVGKTISYNFEADIGTSYGSKHPGKHYLKFDVNDAKWYEWRTDLTQLSMAFPSITIDVVGEGEESGDQWKARFRDGDSEFVEAIVTYPDFERLI